MSTFGMIPIAALPSLWEAVRKATLEPTNIVAWEQIRYHLKLVEPVVEREEIWPDVFDYRDDDAVITSRARKQPRDVSTVRRICVHQKGIAFGTSAAQRKTWRARLVSGDVHPSLLAIVGREPIEDLTVRAALHWRVRAQTPYHDSGLLNGDVILSERADRYTHHGNGANAESIGLGLEGLFPALVRGQGARHNKLDAFTIETFRAAMRLSVIKRREEGCPIEEVEHHRQHASLRAGDAGEGIHKEVVIPVARELNLIIAHDRKTGTGQVITDLWDPASPFDARGRRK